MSRKGSGASASGLKKLLCSLSQSTKQRLGRFRCYSMEQLPAPGGSPPAGPRVKKSPSLQSLQLVSLDIAPHGRWHKGKDAGLGWSSPEYGLMAQAVLEGRGGMHHPELAGFEKPGANWEVEGGRREGGVVVEEQICSSLLSSEVGIAPAGWHVPVSSTPSAHH